MVTAAESVYSTCSATQREEYASATTYRNRPAPQPVHVWRAIRERTELFGGMETSGPAVIREEAAAQRRDRRGGNREHAAVL